MAGPGADRWLARVFRQRGRRTTRVALPQNRRGPAGSVHRPHGRGGFRSTQYLTDADARAMAAHLQALPSREPPSHRGCSPGFGDGAGRQGGTRPNAPSATATAGRSDELRHLPFRRWRANAVVTLPTLTNLARVVPVGGYPPANRRQPASARHATVSAPCGTKTWRR